MHSFCYNTTVGCSTIPGSTPKSLAIVGELWSFSSCPLEGRKEARHLSRFIRIVSTLTEACIGAITLACESGVQRTKSAICTTISLLIGDSRVFQNCKSARDLAKPAHLRARYLLPNVLRVKELLIVTMRTEKSLVCFRVASRSASWTNSSRFHSHIEGLPDAKVSAAMLP
ncbi:leucine zipper putative tumor suppressor 1-like [Plakobranchus ocellatus]|uniref:Leucine zipper putative tumor suppressor 1-like n=1 Tax=Plakobranchus ocellatus TaxID=259542 RepID=A0AAV3XUS1_9GAST|nr:leucine zipper putative tumor suppressor 1-like [Plakobranchus ocellatus]